MKHLTFWACVALASTCFSADSGNDLDRLQKQYKEAIAKANEPITKTYVAELRKLLDRYTKGNQLADAKRVMAEIEARTGKVDEPTDAEKELQKMLVNRTWKMVGGSTYTFKKDGDGVRDERGTKTPFLWRENGPGVVEVQVKLETGDFRTFYFKIESLKQAYYGDRADETKLPLTLES